jgi:hypothetical protein
MDTTGLLASIKRGVTVPSNQSRFTDADILALADEETQTKLLPVLLSMRQEYLVKRTSVTLVPLQNSYSIPYRSIGRTIRSISIVTGTNSQPLNYIQPETAESYGSQSGSPSYFYFEGDNYILVPNPSSAQTLTLKYEIQPSNLVPTTSAGLITAINTVSNYVTISSVPDTFTVNTLADFIAGKNSNSIIDLDKAITNVSGTNIYFDSLPSTLAVGDYIALAGQSPVIQLPREMHQVLAQAVECRLLEALGDSEGLQASSAKLQEKITAMLSLLAPRQKGSQLKIVQSNGLLSRGKNKLLGGF